MGLDIHALNLMRLASRQGADFSRVLMLGRLGLFLDDRELRAFCEQTGRPWTAGEAAALRGDGFCEAFLRRAFGAREITALDVSPYDGATLIRDLNTRIIPEAQFDAVFDFGCLEHVFNLPMGLSNAIALCRDGGHLLHVAPANNWCGHGFYQFSPELFFNVYSESRGFQGTEVFLVETTRPGEWFRIANPGKTGKRVNVVNRERTNVLVLTRKAANAVLPADVPAQQSDYVVQWQQSPAPEAKRSSSWRAFSRSAGLSTGARHLRTRLRAVRSYLFGHKERLKEGRRGVERLDVAALLRL